ncbi:Long-chain-fatty-acid--CoA ligase [Geobacillus sp. B4113_201601]|nr:Long-chain-fatty-acid--CoA ligase [Geobacillus sp. B4113_201601]
MGGIGRMNISELLARQARKFPAKTAVIDGETELSYAEVDRMVNRLASSLARLGVGRGDKVALYMPNTKEFVVSYFAVLRLGAVVVPINARLTAASIFTQRKWKMCCGRIQRSPMSP